MILYEVTVQVQQLCVKILFNNIPTLGHVCDAMCQIFANEQRVQHGMIELVLSVGDDNRDAKLKIGDEIRFVDAGVPIGHIELQTRTLFDA